MKLTHATALFLFHSSRLDARLRRTPARRLQTPSTLILAGKEQIIRSEPTRQWFARICAEEFTVELFEQDAHTIEFAADVSRYERLLRHWAKAP